MENVDFLSIVVVAFGLSADCFAVALSGSVSSSKVSFWRVFRIALSFGLFQTLMTVLGWLLGRTIVEFISAYDHWLAFVLLAFVGGRMLWESFHAEEGRHSTVDITRGFLLLTLSVATSIDALAVGLSFAFLKINIAFASLIIGAVAFMVTAGGFRTRLSFWPVMVGRTLWTMITTITLDSVPVSTWGWACQAITP